MYIYEITKMTSINYLFWLPYQHIPLVRYSALSSTYTGEISAAPYPQNHEMVRFGRDLWRSSGPVLFRQGHPEQTAQDHVQLAFKDLQGDSIKSLGNLYQHFTPTVKCFLIFI